MGLRRPNCTTMANNFFPSSETPQYAVQSRYQLAVEWSGSNSAKAIGDPPRNTIDQKPSTPLPLPARHSTAFIGQAVIQAEHALYDKESVGHLVWCSCGVFLQARIDIECADLQIQGPILDGTSEPFHSGPLAEADDMRLDDRQSGNRPHQENAQESVKFNTHGPSLSRPPDKNKVTQHICKAQNSQGGKP